jgi:hypothetical protein
MGGVIPSGASIYKCMVQTNMQMGWASGVLLLLRKPLPMKGIGST